MPKTQQPLAQQHDKLTQSNDMKVISHVQREHDDWFVNTLMLENVAVPFKYKRKKPYRSLKGSLVNVTYYPDVENVAGLEFEYMKVVRLRRS